MVDGLYLNKYISTYIYRYIFIFITFIFYIAAKNCVNIQCVSVMFQNDAQVVAILLIYEPA